MHVKPLLTADVTMLRYTVKGQFGTIFFKRPLKLFLAACFFYTLPHFRHVGSFKGIKTRQSNAILYCCSVSMATPHRCTTWTKLAFYRFSPMLATEWIQTLLCELITLFVSVEVEQKKNALLLFIISSFSIKMLLPVRNLIFKYEFCF